MSEGWEPTTVQAATGGAAGRPPGEDEGRRDLMLSGVVTAGGGVYRNVHVSGVGRIEGDVVCERARIDGVMSVRGSLEAQELVANGKATIEGALRGHTLRLSGQIRVDGDCAAEVVELAGALHVDGLVSADEVTIRLYGGSKVRELGGGRIRVLRSWRWGFLTRYRRLTVDAVEGDDIRLEATRARVVRGDQVHIGPGCDVDRVEYRTGLRVDDGAHVRERVQV
ncbi:polymer-forming cytoskeletal protein [Alicyclobacillus sp.]|uniref:polymer-forming cytoskeletal protein n=1 Tax=Alicyclobacillus sp. TaxID=61169 RepID=UPI0025B90276|nr:polymer-forming cytoskeletal protein [Alicyclobacillus sp.]MCL6518027.1 polymer-forming cytoskeletal protein [Alicyclobacillus sp.]